MSHSTAARLVILGAAGDLTGRYLLPALAELEAAGRLPAGAAIVGVSLDRWDDGGFRRHASLRLSRHAAHVPSTARDALVSRLRYVHADVTDATALTGAVQAGEPVVAYLALPPVLFEPAIRAVTAAGLPDGSRIVVEKPFGTDVGSARRLNALLHDRVPEDAVFRVDHFLGMQTVQNLLGLRFANRMFEPLWCADHVAAVDIVWDETVALEGRAGYYDHTGALRDMVQNHLLQILALVAMEQPKALDEAHLRDAKAVALRSVRPMSPAAVATDTVRGRYTAGAIGTRRLPAYTDEPDVDPDRRTETFAEVVAFVDNDRWRGVPFRMRTGKALGRDRRHIAVHFHPATPLPFAAPDAPPPNRLLMTMDPDRVELDLSLNGAGDPFRLEPAALGLDLAPQSLSAYARLLLDAFAGTPVLTPRDDEIETSWQIVEPILAAWADDATPLLPYPAGSTGPHTTMESRSSSVPPVT
jgi:glucose-6-phosphate 1-dehydrogenase